MPLISYQPLCVIAPELLENWAEDKGNEYIKLCRKKTAMVCCSFAVQNLHKTVAEILLLSVVCCTRVCPLNQWGLGLL